MSYSDKNKYTKDHEWIAIDGEGGTVGITAYALEQLGDVVHLELPEVGQSFAAGDSFGTIESTKTVSDLYMPVGGEVVEVNQELLDAPEQLVNDPNEKGWLLRVKVKDLPTDLMDAAAYTAYVESEASK